VEIFFLEDFEIFLELGDHDGEEVAVLVFGKDAAKFFHSSLFVFALDDGAFVDADADGEFFGFASLDDVFDLGAVVDVAGVEADFVNPGLDGFHGALEMEMDVGDDGDADLGDDFLEGGGVFFLRDGDADEVGAGGGELVDLGDAFIDFVGVTGGHGLDGDGGVAADGDETVGLVPEYNFPRLSAANHQLLRVRSFLRWESYGLGAIESIYRRGATRDVADSACCRGLEWDCLVFHDNPPCVHGGLNGGERKYVIPFEPQSLVIGTIMSMDPRYGGELLTRRRACGIG
jgi:hypothetical protein